MLIEKIDIVKKRYDEIYQMISNPEIIADQKKYIELNKELKEISILVNKGKLYKEAIDQKDEAEGYIKSSDDKDMIEMAKEQLEISKQSIEKLEDEIKILLIPKDPDDAKNVVVEIRAGTGGDEASIFAGDLYRMYTKFAQEKKWNLSIVDTSEGTAGGFKEVIFEIAGEDVYGELKYESGVHRVQRVPQTETQGRIHTSAATVAVLPMIEEVDIQIEPKDLRIDTFRSQGAGGQHVNTTDSAVRITHIPTNVVASCQEEKSQHKNKAKAMKMLASRLYEKNKTENEEKIANKRKSMVGSGDRSEKIRSYNYPQGRVTDHRINLTLYKLEDITSGIALDEVIEPLLAADLEAKIKSL